MNRRPLACGTAIVAVALTAACAGVARPTDPASRYIAIATPANMQLERAFDALHGIHRNDLAASVTDLHTISAVERAFDRHLRTLTLTTAEARTARALIAANESRADVTADIASSTSLTTLHALQPRLAAADRPVEAQVRILRRQLGLPPPKSS